MIAFIAALCFAVALVVHLIGGHADVVYDFLIGGALAVALHLAFGIGWPWVRRTP